MDVSAIQSALSELRIDGWLFFDHHRRDPLAYRILGLPQALNATRRWYYWIPAAGDPVGIVHRVEPHALDSLPGQKIEYSSWQEQSSAIERALAGARRVAMQYSPRCAIPYISLVDAGTIELVRSTGAEVVSSADLVQLFQAVLTDAQRESHYRAGTLVDGIRKAAFEFIGAECRARRRIDECAVRAMILEQFGRAGLATDSGPIVAVNEHAADPHYEPSAATAWEVKQGSLVLIDMWAKFDEADAVYYDITWTGFCGPVIPEPIQTVFGVVRTARDRAVERVQNSIRSGTELRGYEVDDAAREYISSKGYGERFIHRTGHSIGVEVHGTGANMDNLESHDERRVIAGTCFSVEPGIYLDHFGIRSEVNMFVEAGDAAVTGEVQTELVEISTRV